MFVSKKSLQKTFIKEISTIKDCVYSLNASSLQIANVVNDKGELIGTITDGDIRRGLLNGLALKSPIKKILNKTPITSNSKISTDDAEKILKRFEIIHLPILKKKRIIDLYYKGFSKSKIAKIDNKVIIMAGGYGKRLGKLTKKTPKGMLKLNGKPLLQHIIEGLKNEGFHEICISTHFKKEKIKKFFDNGKRFGVKIDYLEEKNPMGTIGSIGLLNNLKKPFFVINCDVITNLNFQEMLKFHISKKSFTTMAIKSYEFMNPYGVVNSKKNKFIGFREKPISYFNINAGIYAFNPTIIKIINKNKLYSIIDLFKYLKKHKKKVLTFSMFENWIDYGLDKKNLKE
jgi:dTDP-glucose pyrophosphorylase